MKHEVPFWKKSNMTLEEAAAYFGIGINKLRKLFDDDYNDKIIKTKKILPYKEHKIDLWIKYLNKRKKILRFKMKGGNITVCQWRKEVSL